MKSTSPRRPACCSTSAPGRLRRWQPFSIARPAGRSAGLGCSPRPRPRCSVAGFDCCHCRESARCAACVAAATPGRRASTRAGAASRCCAPSRYSVADGGCSCGAAARCAATGSGSTPAARRARRIVPSVAHCAGTRESRGRCAILRGAAAPQGGHPQPWRPGCRDAFHVPTNRCSTDRELSPDGPVYPAHDAHAPWSIAWQQDSRPGRRA